MTAAIGKPAFALAFAAAIVWPACGASAQTIYRCGAAGNDYSQQPCAGGRAIDVADPRSAEQMAQARAVDLERRRLAAEMARDRLADERAHPPLAAAGIDNARAATAVPPGTDARAAKPNRPGARRSAAKVAAGRDDFVAFAPGSRSSKRKRQD